MAVKAKETFEEKLNNFINAHLKKFVLICVIGVLVVLGYVFISSANSTAAKADIEAIEQVQIELKMDDEASVSEALKNLEQYTEKSGVAGVRANLLVAEIKYAQKDFVAAAASYEKAANAQKGAYTAPVAYFNAAVCYESLEEVNLDKAIENYANACEYKDFPKYDHALFSLARANETKGDIEAAKKAYSRLVEREKFYSDLNPYELQYVAGWINLAKSRLIDLENK